ncbi:hypothetical protein OIV83_005778 [Microbotryomycetes sp. JL201]|nr:hypothetical protein OIV83_005778 [Microbotryomycetes sp. JL201]
MQRAQLTDAVHVSYIDTWADHNPTKAYTTIIGLHGTGYNSNAWLKPFEFTKTSDSVRFIAYNQRSYAGSTPQFDIKEPAGVDATGAYLEDLVRFIAWTVDELKLPPYDVETGRGGLILLGWSKGTVLLFALLATLHGSPSSPTAFTGHINLSERDLSVIQSHVRTVLMFEPPGSALARPVTDDFKTQMAHVAPPNTPTPTEYAEAFARWISGWSTKPANLTEERLPGAEAWEAECCLHGFAWRLSSNPQELLQIAKTALCPSSGVAIPIGIMYGSNTVEYCLDSSSVIQKWWGVSPNEKGQARVTRVGKTAVRAIAHQNHFAFENDPQQFVEVLTDILQELSPGAM